MENSTGTDKKFLDIRKIKSIDTINFIIEDLGLESANQLATLLNYARAEKIYKILRGENSISKKVAEEINAVFPQYKTDYILDGDVERLKNKNNENENNLSLLTLQDFQLLPLEEKLIIIFKQNSETMKLLIELNDDIKFYGLKKKLLTKKTNIENSQKLKG